MTLEDSVHDFRLHVLHRAKELGNVSAACREAGISRTLFYRWRKRFERYGPDGLHPTRRHAARGRPPALDPQDERSILALALAWPTWGPQRIVPAANAQETSRFLTETLVPLYQKAGWTIRRILTDRGSEYGARFDEACRALGIRHTRTKPRHAWTNGFVERLQGTILHEHWRVVFRRRYFTSRRQLQDSLDRFLHFYNHKRPHLGYRTRGRTPADIFLGAFQ